MKNLVVFKDDVEMHAFTFTYLYTLVYIPSKFILVNMKKIMYMEVSIHMQVEVLSSKTVFASGVGRRNCSSIRAVNREKTNLQLILSRS